MGKEKPQTELARLRKEQNKTRQDEVFGGLSSLERAEYNQKTERVRELESEIQASAVAEKKSQSGKSEQRRQWNKESETDTPQSEAHQPYRSREKDSTNPCTDSLRTNRGKRKNDSDEKGRE